MKAIGLWQPYASLIPLGLKQYETRKCPRGVSPVAHFARSWGTNYRGELVICSAKRNKDDQFYQWIYILQELEGDLGILKAKPNNGFPMWDDLPFGCAICIVNLIDCIKMTQGFIAEQTEAEKLVGDWEVDRFACKLENIRNFANPTPIQGRQRLFDIEVDLLEIANV